MKIADDPDRYMIEQPNGCIEWSRSRTKAGYGRFRLRGKIVYTHRYAYEKAYGPIPDGMFVMHSCDNPPCCNPFHLSVGTAEDNAKDRDSKGRGGTTTHGNYVGYRNRERQPRKVTNEAVVRAIRRLYSQGLRNGEIADKVGVSRRTVGRVLDGSRHQNVW